MVMNLKRQLHNGNIMARKQPKTKIGRSRKSQLKKAKQIKENNEVLKKLK